MATMLENIKAKAISVAVNKAFDMLYDDFDGNLPKVESMINKFVGSGDEINDAQLRLFNMVMGYLKTPGNNWRELILHVIDNVDREIARTFVNNFFVNSVTIGGNIQRRVNDAEGCNCPWAILMDPTTRCNLHCNGCWAANYTSANHQDLTFEELDSIITQGVEMGTYVYLFTGGEPMTRKNDLIKLCEKHSDCFASRNHFVCAKKKPRRPGGGRRGRGAGIWGGIPAPRSAPGDGRDPRQALHLSRSI